MRIEETLAEVQKFTSEIAACTAAVPEGVGLRALVLTSSTGGGHDARAAAFQDWVGALHGPAVQVRVEHMLERSSPVGRFGVAFYNWIQRRAPFLHVPYYTLVEGLGILNSGGVSFGAAYYRQVLESFRPHLILSVHDCLNRGYFQLARQVLGTSVRCATYCGEFSGGWGFSRNWVEPSADLFVARTHAAGEYAIKLGMPRNKVRTRGHFLALRAAREVLDGESRRRMRERLGLAPDRLTLLMATGGSGANNHRELLPTLSAHADWLQVIFMCGRDAQVREWLGKHLPSTKLRAAVLPYSDEVHLLMQASDLVFTRGGTTTCAKALHFNTPILFNSFGGVMPQERLTLKYFLRGGARQAGNVRDFNFLLEQLRDDPTSLPSLQADFSRLRYEGDTRELIEELIALAREAAGLSSS